MRREPPVRISVRRGELDVPLYPVATGDVVSNSPGPRLIGEKHRISTLEIPDHEHTDFCFHLQTAGTPQLEWWSDGRNQIEEPKPGALILLPPGTRDRLRWNGHSERFVISLDANCVRDVLDEIGQASEPGFVSRWHFRDEVLRQLLCEIGREATDGWPLGTLYADQLGLALATLLLRRHAEAPVNFPAFKGGLPVNALRSSLEYMTDNLHRNIRLQEVASLAGLSPFHFSRLFKSSTGQTPHQYLLDQRMRRAKEFLRAGVMPVAQIGSDLGFQSPTHFARSFRAREGQTPTAWKAVAGSLR